MKNWYMLMLTGKDQPGIVSSVSQKLYELNSMLGESSMQRLGCSFTIMMMVQSSLSREELADELSKISNKFDLYFELREIEENLPKEHLEPNFRIVVHGADQTGIVARVTSSLSSIGANIIDSIGTNIIDSIGTNIIDIESTVTGHKERALYILTMEIAVNKDKESIELILNELQMDVSISVHDIDSFIG